MRKLWLFASFSLAGCSTQTNSTPEVVQVARPTSAPVVVATPAPVVEIPSPAVTLPDASPKTVVDKRFEQQQEIVLRELEKLQNAIPEQDLQVAWQNKDYRFVAVRTIGTQVFGVPGDITNLVVQKYGMKAIEGTGDVVFSPEQAKLQKMGIEYSIKYNQLLMKKLTG